MAISASKKGNLVDTVVVETSIKDRKIPDSTKPESEKERVTIEKKRGFFASTLDELKLTEWPSFSYVAKWSVIIILFTAFFAVVIGLFDSAFTSGVNFIDCTSKQGRNREIKECTDDFLKNLTGR